MKLNSKYFDRIRVKPDADRSRRTSAQPPCEWPGCGQPGTHKAPRGRNHEGEYVMFCLDHVKDYNKAYNYFEGMADDAVLHWQKDSLTGHRPTWRLGENSWAAHRSGKRAAAGGYRHNTGFRDPFGMFEGQDGTTGQSGPARPARTVRNAELKALHALGLEEGATGDQVKSQYKTLVKRLHPDANGGSRANEDKLKEVIESYDYLRSLGYC